MFFLKSINFPPETANERSAETRKHEPGDGAAHIDLAQVGFADVVAFGRDINDKQLVRVRHAQQQHNGQQVEDLALSYALIGGGHEKGPC